MSKKKEIREAFRNAVFSRDKNRCRVCKRSSADFRKDNSATITGNSYLNAHHITDRNLMPNGGYVVENGISLCPECHIMAEEFHSTGEAYESFSPDDLYVLIGSSYELALESSKKLGE